MYIGVDGCSTGWVAVQFDDDNYEDTNLYEDIQELWMAHGDAAEQILIDVPIGLRENSNKKRLCDDAARKKLSPKRHSSVFPVPVRAAVHEESYEDAKEMQEKRTDGSLGVQHFRGGAPDLKSCGTEGPADRPNGPAAREERANGVSE
jgi:predicted RNase H-like nuclease